MHARFADHIVNESDFIDDLAQISHRFTEEFARLTVWLKLPDRLHPRSEAVLKCFDVLAKITLLPVPFHQLGLEIKQVDMAGRAGHEHLNHALCTRLEVRDAWKSRAVRCRSEQILRSQANLPGQFRQALPPSARETHGGRVGLLMTSCGEMENCSSRQSTKENSFKLNNTRQRLAKPELFRISDQLLLIRRTRRLAHGLIIGPANPAREVPAGECSSAAAKCSPS